MNYNDLKEIIDKEIKSISWGENIVGEACRYSVDSGKRLRSVLLLAFYLLFKRDYQEAIPFALALELIHNYSLIHDDLPCMDDDLYRRGELTVHAKYGEDIAVLAGDNLLNKAYEILFNNLENSTDPRYKIKAASHMSKAAGMAGMIGGQVIDILNTAKNIEDIKEMYKMKTSALIHTACICGTLLAESEENLIFAEEFGHNIGMIFQLTDDLLDIKEDEKVDKITYLSFATKDELKKELENYSNKMDELLNSTERDTTFLKNLYLKMLHREI